MTIDSIKDVDHFKSTLFPQGLNTDQAKLTVRLTALGPLGSSDPPQPTYHHPHLHPAYPSRDGYPQQGGDPRQADPRQADPGYYPPPPVQPRGPLRQDVPPSPPVPVRTPRYDTLNRGPPGGGGGYRQASPERYAYGDPRQTSAMTAAV